MGIFSMIETYNSILLEINNIFENENLVEKLNQIYISFDEIFVDSEISPDDDLILKLYYNSYQGLFICFKLLNQNDNVKNHFEKFGGIFEKLSKINNININSHELIFESAISYYLSGNYVRAQLLANDFDEFELPNFKKYILSFLNKDFIHLRNEILIKFNSDEFDEEIVLNKLKNNEITEFNAFCTIFNFYILQSINYALNFAYSGDEQFINWSLEIIDKYKHVAFEYNYVEYWWSFLVLELLVKKLFNNSLWYQLDSFDDDNGLTNLFIKNKLNSSIVELWDSQIRAIKLITDENRTNFCINTPTSSGKTLIAELTILQFLIDTECSEKVVYISPYKSLSHEIEGKLKKSFKNFDLKISEFYGGFDSNLYEISYIEDLDILILTPEKFDYLLRMNPQIKDDIGLIIIDEGHIIGKPEERGLNFEFFVYRIQHYYEYCRFVFISGVLPNIRDFSQLFSGSPDNIISSKWKPTDVYVGTLEWKNKVAKIKYLSKNDSKINNSDEYLFYENNNLKFIKNDNFQLALSAVMLAKDGSTFVYIRNKREVENLANEIVSSKEIFFKDHDLALNFEENDEDVVEFIKMVVDEFGEGSKYLDYIDSGFFIHHRDLPDNIKLKIEELLKLNKIKLIIGTSTLINGVNFPIKNIILKNMQMGKPLMDYHSFNNLCGRVGRAKIENSGRVFLYLSDLNNSNNQMHLNHLNKLLKDEENINSIFLYLFGIFEKEGIDFKNKNSDSDFFEKLNESLSKLKNRDKLFIDNLDKQLLAFFEENKDYYLDNDLITEVVDNSLFAIQSGNLEYMKNLLKARWYFIKKSYNSKSFRKIYECGLFLQDFDLIDSNKEIMLDYVKQLNNWFELSFNEQEELLFEIAKFLTSLKISSKLSKNRHSELILKYWIKQFNANEIIKILKEGHDIKVKEQDIVSFINECKYIIPWGMTSILNYVYNNFPVKISDICYNVVDMFKFGVFDLKISILMPIFNDFALCEELSRFIKVHWSIPDMLYYLRNIDAHEISEDNREKFIDFIKSNEREIEHFIIYNFDDFDINDNDKFIIKKSGNEFLFYKLDGDYLFKYSNDLCLNVEYYDSINDINKIWSVYEIDNSKISLY